MTDRAAILGSLVDVRNIGVHKSVKLTIHVPEELAETVINAFGWPTGVNPVAVAIARLNSELPQEAKEPEPASVEPLPARARNPDKRLISQAGEACCDPRFQRFLYEENMIENMEEGKAATAVRLICGVQSRKELLVGTPAGEQWRDLYGKFLAWKQAA
jgi:hypothetical protein